jgi:hypothetical protein
LTALASGGTETKEEGFALLTLLTQELNPSTQRCLTRSLLGILLIEPWHFVNA